MFIVSITVLVMVAGFGVSWFIVGLMTALQVRTPLRLQGRVSSAADVFISTPQTVSIAVGLLQAWPMAVLVDAVLTPAPRYGWVHKLFLVMLPRNMLAQVIGVTLISA